MQMPPLVHSAHESAFSLLDYGGVMTLDSKGPSKNEFVFLAHGFAAELVSPRERNRLATAEHWRRREA